MTVLGVSRDAMKKHEKFIGKYELAVPLVSDEDGRDLRGVRHLGRKVDVRPQIYGDGARDLPHRRDGRVLQVWRKVKVPGHAAEVLRAARDAEAA